jgi:galactonate dehydratase
VAQRPTKCLRSAQLLWDHGWRVIRTGMLAPRNHGEGIFEPRETLGITAKALIKIRETLGDELTLGIDYHHRLSLAETASFCQRMPVGTIDFIEEPMRDESPEAYEALRKMTPIPFAVGEEFASKWQFAPFIERHLTDFARLDICNVGGFTRIHESGRLG